MAFRMAWAGTCARPRRSWSNRSSDGVARALPPNPLDVWRHRDRPTSFRRQGHEFSRSTQVHQARYGPNYSLHHSLFGLFETPLPRLPRSDLSCSPRRPVRCSPRCAGRCGLSRSTRCHPGCCPDCGPSCSPCNCLRCSTRCSTGRSDHCGLIRCPRRSPLCSDRCSPECLVNSTLSCCPSCSVHCCPDCGNSRGLGQLLTGQTRLVN
jgi:hypothetical protein